VDLPPGLIVISGLNGQGKSNLLEALYLLSIAKSYRTNVEREMMSWNTQLVAHEALSEVTAQTIVTGVIEQDNNLVQLIIGLRPLANEKPGGRTIQKQIRVDGLPTSAANAVGLINAVLFTAADVDLVLGSPSGRRRFLDIVISQVDRIYLRTLQRYQKVVSQRNALLRSIREGRATPTELDFWDAELEKEASVIITKRNEAIEQISGLAINAYHGLNTVEKLAVIYQPSVDAPALASVLASQRATEIRAGVTTFGPHRDDIALLINDMSASNYASRGQARSVAFALRLAEASFLRARRNQEPILLLDDVLSELDTNRRRRVLEEATAYQQVIVTTAEPMLTENTHVRPESRLWLSNGILS